MEADELLEELESDVDEMEEQFKDVKNPDAEGTMREKQQRAEQLIEKIHDQLKFLQEQVNRKE